MLVVQYGLGIILNLYIAVPASDAHAGLMQEIVSGPAMLLARVKSGGMASTFRRDPSVSKTENIAARRSSRVRSVDGDP